MTEKYLIVLPQDINETNENQRIIFNDSDIIFSKEHERVAIKKMLNERKIALEPTIERLIDWIRNKIISGSRMGEKNSQVIFSDILKIISLFRKLKQPLKTRMCY